MPADLRAQASAAICDTAAALLPPPGVLALYAAKGSEVDPARLDQRARALGWAVAYPRVRDGARSLSFHLVGLDELAPSRFGLREPSADAPQVAIDAITAFIVPGLAFDRAGGRIGWGRGHYDATFSHASPAALRLGLAFDAQLVEQVAREPHDVALHIIITEVATYRIV